MANTRTSTKRAGQAKKRQAQNQLIKGHTRSALREALDAFKSKDLEKAKAAYQMAVRALSKAGSKHVIPKTRAARKVSRLTAFAKKMLPALFSAPGKSA